MTIDSMLDSVKGNTSTDEVVSKENARRFVILAGSDLDKWRTLEGHQIIHSKYGAGDVVEVRKRGPIRLRVKFDDVEKEFIESSLDESFKVPLPSALLEIVSAEEQEQATKSKELKDLVKKYRRNPRGIRNSLEMHNVCIGCGSRNVALKTDGGSRRCLDCGATWYVNRCWHCRPKALRVYVDSRDPETPKCRICGWHKCANCGACESVCH